MKLDTFTHEVCHTIFLNELYLTRFTLASFKCIFILKCSGIEYNAFNHLSTYLVGDLMIEREREVYYLKWRSNKTKVHFTNVEQHYNNIFSYIPLLRLAEDIPKRGVIHSPMVTAQTTWHYCSSVSACMVQKSPLVFLSLTL